MRTRQIRFSDDIGPRPELGWLALDLLVVDRNYQRDAIPKHIQVIAAGFDWRYFQPPTVCPDGNGGYWVIDGQQRVHAAKLHPAVDEVPCYIVDTPLTKDQAAAFVRVNRDRRNVNPVNMYWAGIAGEDPKYLAVRRILHSAGAEVSQSLGWNAPKTTNSVASILRSIQRCGESNAASAIRVLCEAYPDTPNVLTGNLIQALATLFRDYDDISEDRLVTLLAGINLDILNTEALNTRKLIGGSTVTVLNFQIVRRYNKGLGAVDRLREPA